MIKKNELVLCPNCYVDNIEKHSKFINGIETYICCNCFLRFTNYDFILSNKIKYRNLVIEENEASYKNILQNAIKNITYNGILDYMSMDELTYILKSIKTQKEGIVTISQLELKLKQLKDNCENKGI